MLSYFQQIAFQILFEPTTQFVFKRSKYNCHRQSVHVSGGSSYTLVATKSSSLITADDKTGRENQLPFLWRVNNRTHSGHVSDLPRVAYTRKRHPWQHKGVMHSNQVAPLAVRKSDWPVLNMTGSAVRASSKTCPWAVSPIRIRSFIDKVCALPNKDFDSAISLSYYFG